MTTETTTKQIATQIAETIVEDLRDTAMGRDRNTHMRIWQPEGRDSARIYTGHGGEYLEVYKDGRIERSRSRMSWGHVIDEVLAADPMEG